MIWPLIAASLGLLKSEIDKENEHKDREISATTARYRPFTGLTPQNVERANTFGNVASFGAQGAALGQNLEDHEASQGIAKALAAKIAGKEKAPADASLLSDLDEQYTNPLEDQVRVALQKRAKFSGLS